MNMFRFIFGDTRGPSNNEPFARDGMFGENYNDDNGIDSIFQHFHSDMQQHMEEIQQQMDDMVKSFGAVEFSNIPHVEFPTSDASGSSNEGSNLRDAMLKTPDAPPMITQLPSEPPAVIAPSSRREDSSFFGSFGLPSLSPFTRHTVEPKVDRDLDGRALDVLKDLQQGPQCTECQEPNPMPSNSFFSGRSVSVRSVQNSDGKMEQWRTVQDSSGRKEETCTRFVDGKVHTVTRKIDERGNEEKIEEFENMDESDLSAFNKTWNVPKTDAADMPQPPRQDSYMGRVFKLFGF